MRGTTNAVPAASGGLKVIASGDYLASTPGITINFGTQAKYVLVCYLGSAPFGEPNAVLLSSEYSSSVYTNGCQVSLSNGGGTLNGTVSSSSNLNGHLVYLALG